MKNPLSFRCFSTDACIKLLAKCCALGSGYRASLSTPGLGVFMQPAKTADAGASEEEKSAIEQYNSSRPILYVDVQ